MRETERFTGYAAVYNAGRPAYPPEVVDVVLGGLGDPHALKVADLGAGTGLSARLFTERGATVFAVEPNAAMREKGAAVPGIVWVDGTAERTGLEDHSMDVVVAFQAFHWFDPGVALAEITRILRRGGRAAVAFYERDETDAFTGAYGEIVRRFTTDDTERGRARALDTFEAWPGWVRVERHVVLGEHVLDAEGLAVRVASSSYLPHSGPESERLREAVDALFAQYAQDGCVRMKLQTIIALAEPRS